MVPVLQRNANSNMAADTSGTKIQPMCIYQSLIDGFRRVKEKSCFRSTPFPFSIPPSTMIILYHFSADKSISNSSSLARTSARKLDLKKQRQSWIHVLYSYRVMTRDSTYLCVKIKHLAKDYVKNGKSGRRVVVAKADHSMDAVYLSLSLSLSFLPVVLWNLSSNVYFTFTPYTLASAHVLQFVDYRNVTGYVAVATTPLSLLHRHADRSARSVHRSSTNQIRPPRALYIYVRVYSYSSPKKTYKYSRMLIILLFVLPMNLLCFTMCPPADLTCSNKTIFRLKSSNLPLSPPLEES